MELLQAEIREQGPLPFSRFMEQALYHPEWGYYRRAGHDPFGGQGDYYTAAHVQPVFGRLIRQAVAQLTDVSAVVELGPGRGEMAAAFAGLGYFPIAYGDSLPSRLAGLVFSNEFFDALPVDVAVCEGEQWAERYVTWADGRFRWMTAPARPDVLEYCHRYPLPTMPGTVVETHQRGLAWVQRLDDLLGSGYVLTIDYGYRWRELLRFPQGTLMSYRRHRADEDVLYSPGTQDITSHVPFSALRAAGEALGWRTLREESLASFLLRAGEPDQFRGALAGVPGGAGQLKNLLFGMGETFQVLLQQKQKGSGEPEPFL